MSAGAIVLWVVCAVIAGMISDRKNNGFVNGFVIGVLLNIFGVIIVMCLKPGVPKPPRGFGGGEVSALQHGAECAGGSASVRVLAVSSC